MMTVPSFRVPILTVALAFCAGVCALHSCSTLPSYPWLVGLILAGSLLSWCLRGTLRWILIACIVGFLWCGVQAAWRLTWEWPLDWEGQPRQIRVKIVEMPQASEAFGGWSFVGEVVQACHAGTCLQPGGKIQLSGTRLRRMPQAGEIWAFEVRARQPHGFRNPGTFDSERQWFARGIRAFGSVQHGRRLEKGWSIHQWRHALYQRMQAHHPHALIPALTLGVRQGITPTQWATFRDTGTAHLIAISGLHIGGLAAVIYPLACFFWQRDPRRVARYPAPLFAAVVCMVVTVVYSLLAGWSIPTQRACWMILVVMIANLLRSPHSFWPRWGFALLVILCVDPFAPLSMGFWLSFGAVAWFVLGNSWLAHSPRWWQNAGSAFFAALGLLGLTAYFFGQMTLISPLANAIAIPWMGLVILPAALLGTLTLFFYPLSQLFLWIADFNLWALEGVLAILAQYPLLFLHFSPSMSAVCLSTMGALWLCAPPAVPGRVWALCCFLPLFHSSVPPVAMGDLRCTALDVGQGLAVVLETANHVLVYDTGPRFGLHSDAGQRMLLPFLYHQGHRRVDSLILSHLDMDHIGGAPSLRAAMPVDVIFSSQPYGDALICQKGQAWEWDGVSFEFLYPPHEMGEVKKNNRSCVLQVRVGTQRILLPGDIEASAEHRLVEDWGNQLHANIVFVPHHGSRTSSSPGFLKAVNPVYGLLSMGYRNPYGHPHPTIVARYAQAGISLLSNVEEGAISVEMGADGRLEIRGFRRMQPHYWQHRPGGRD